MEKLGSMEPEQLLQLLTGSITCAVIIFLFIIAYFLITRRGSQAKLGTGGYSQRPINLPAAPTLPPAGEHLVSEASPVDVGARLAGTGREAWLEEEAPVVKGPPPHAGKEVLRVVRDPATGQTWVKVAGVRYRSVNDIRDRAVGERVLAAVTHALRFSSGKVATDQGVATLALPPCDTVSVPAALGVLSDVYEPGEMLRLISDADRGGFCVHVAERCYRRLIDVTDQATGQRILEAITRLLQFSNGMLVTNYGIRTVPVPSLSADAVAPLPTSPTPPAPSLQPQPSASPSPALLSAQEQFLRQLMSQVPPVSEEPVKPPSLIDSIRRVRKQTAEPPPSLNIVAEINRIFQSKLAVSPLVKADAAVEASPDGGVRIRVGTVYYDTPDDVPDVRLREMLKLSIAEWEQS